MRIYIYIYIYIHIILAITTYNSSQSYDNTYIIIRLLPLPRRRARGPHEPQEGLNNINDV